MIPSRRDLIRHTLSSGFALAVTPIASTVLATGADGLEAGEVKIPTSAGDIPAYRAYPKGDGKKKLPVLLVVHEIFGVHEHIKDVCRRLAKLGYFAIAPELFVRQGDASKIPDMKQLVRDLVSKVPDAQVLADLDACVDWASHEARADVERLGVTGFCWGGRITWLYAAHRSSLKAGVAWYGKLVGDRDPLHPTFPLDLVEQLKAPVLGLYGGLDQGIPLASIGQTRGALLASKNAAANRSEFHIYPEAGHAFAADYRPSYRKADAEDGFKRLHAWLKAHGAG
ncbi:MAG TPA: dienelactone hydrolase family protein [Polyangiaceae bacterium]|nr:dienelactone hydrolase family protein [Polyangiaceae bacterium]